MPEETRGTWAAEAETEAGEAPAGEEEAEPAGAEEENEEVWKAFLFTKSGFLGTPDPAGLRSEEKEDGNDSEAETEAEAWVEVEAEAEVEVAPDAAFAKPAGLAELGPAAAGKALPA